MKKVNPIITGTRVVFTLTSIVTLVLGIADYMEGQAFDGGYLSVLLTALISLAITFVPDFVANKNIMVVPIGLQALFSGFTFGAMFLGEILDFYTRFSWWDTMLHFTSGIMFSIIGYLLFLSFNRDYGIRCRLNPVIVVMFTVCFSITCGAIWEIFEFGVDSLLGMNMQRWQSVMPNEQWGALQNVSNFSNPGLINTMKDIISDTLGSVLSVFLILPLARHNNKYKRVHVSQTELIAEYNGALAGIRAIKRAPKTRRPGLGYSVSNRYESAVTQMQRTVMGSGGLSLE